jgi:nucleoside-diphosphate-sugar epimerase
VKIWLTGGTGYIGSAVLGELRAHDLDVVALVRSEESAARVAAAGATPVLGDLRDTDWTAAQLAEVDGAVHLASPGGPEAEAFDTSMARAAVLAFGGTDKPYVHTGGIWSYGSGSGITDDSPLARPPGAGDGDARPARRRLRGRAAAGPAGGGR